MIFNAEAYCNRNVNCVGNRAGEDHDAYWIEGSLKGNGKDQLDLEESGAGELGLI